MGGWVDIYTVEPLVTWLHIRHMTRLFSNGVKNLKVRFRLLILPPTHLPTHLSIYSFIHLLIHHTTHPSIGQSST